MRIPTGALVAITAGLAFASVASAQGRPDASSRRVTPVVEVYRKVSPAVVNISTERLVATRWSLFGMEDDPFEDFLPKRTMRTRSLGSGFLLHADGYVVTNAHVVRRAEKITVTLADQTSYQAEVVADNDTHDLAVLRIKDPKARKFDFLRLGRSDDILIGETVVAIGNPFGLQNTCTTGVVSALDRTLEFSGGSYRGLIQIDAPINPGNSGGPLLNIAGELIGINTAIRADAQGIGFAIPVDLLAADMPRLLDFERLCRVVVGLVVGQQRGSGGEELIVTAVREGTPAAEAGCKAGDRLVALNGHPTAQPHDYLVPMLAARAGAQVKLKLLREGRELEVDVAVKARPRPDGATLAERLFGMTLQAITPELVRRMDLAVDSGLVVAAVAPGGAADRLGLKVGDVVFQLGRWHVSDLEGIGAVLEDVQPGDVLRVGIIRGRVRAWGSIRVVNVDVGRPEPPKARI